ncbi:MAG: RidA family protein [Myxococcales bacterium]|nr:RidA family protein [Myxococcales bacterium]MCB9578758.1 RidA family protein [Polyangiaceae bacterium]
MTLELINPASLGAAKGYSNGVLCPAGGRLLFVAGQVGWDERQSIVSPEFALQFGQALANVTEVVRAAGGTPEHIARLTIYVTDKREYEQSLKQIGAEYRTRMGKHFPAMALLEVKGLLEPGAKVEIEATAVIP